MKNHVVLIISFICLLSISCRESVSYAYQTQLSRYLNEVHGLDVEGEMPNSTLLVLPLKGCHPCLTEIMNYSLSTPIDVNLIIFSGNGQEGELMELSEGLARKYKTSMDGEGQLELYRANISSPSIIYLREGQMRKVELTIDNYSEIFKNLKQ